MSSTLLCMYGMLLLLAASATLMASDTGRAQADGGSSTCSLKLQPAEVCGEADECPYQITLPALTVQLPKQLHLLENTMKELQTLRAEVMELRRACMDCRPQADQVSRGDGDSTLPTQVAVKLNRMSTNLKNNQKRVEALQGRVEELSVVNLKTVEEMVNNKVENITRTISHLNGKCSNPCPVIAPQKLMLAPRDCSDYGNQETKNGVLQVMPDVKMGMFNVHCDMESFGGGWTVIQKRLNGSVSFNRSWDEYKRGFGNLNGEFWLGNDHIHLLTKTKDMVLRIELEDMDGVREYAKYDQFYVANEYLNYRLSVSGYSGTAGDALHHGKNYNHDQKFFSTPDKDNDMYKSGNCGAYYSSGWWFDACMSANLNGKYYNKRYKGVRNGIFWGTWRNATLGIYPTNYRQAFKSVKMMIRPKNYAP